MILIWRGWGLLAVVALFPLLASCAGLITVEPMWVFMIAASLSLLLAGAVCVYFGTRWNQPRAEHSFYFVPLQVWGWGYLGAVGLFALLAVVGGVLEEIKPPPGKPDRGRPAPAYLAAAGGVGLVAVGVTAWALVRSARPRSTEETSGTTDDDGFDRQP